MMPGWGFIVGAVLALLLGLALIIGGQGIRRRRGLGSGKTVSLDGVTLTSARLGLTGRPDRLVKTGGTIIPEEWKSSGRVWPNHRIQMGCYFLLIEEEQRVRPPHGFIVLGDQPFQDMVLLVRLRNEMIHYKSKWGKEMDRQKLFKTLKHMRLAQPSFVLLNASFFPHQFLGAGSSAWAVRTTVAFINKVYDHLGVESRLKRHMSHFEGL
jgi:hypothetical protein